MKTFTLVIGNKNYSSWSLRAWILMKYFKIPFKEIVIPLRQENSQRELLKYSPSGKVPMLIDGNLKIWDSLAIAEYLAEKFPKKNLWPKERSPRAWARSISAEMHSGFVLLRKNCPMDVRSRKEPKVKSDALDNDIKRVCAIWSECLSASKGKGSFLFGKFSIADAMYLPVVFRFETYGITIPKDLQRYSQAMLSIPVVKEWQAASIKEPWVIEH